MTVEQSACTYTMLSVELTQGRKGTVRALFDMRNGIMKWQETNRWNRNFTRSLSDRDVQRLQEMILSCRIPQWQPYFPDRPHVEAEQPCHVRWELSLFRNDVEPELHFEGCDDFPPSFGHLRDVLTLVIRQPFQVLD